eukprot:TRINITY_DN10922_c0_g1_i1.p1 TRINITY_DN10922_c0_g1~~TRINITY_DN10922_c0_g1_i1.p1  ORF type:complete len:520 (+),score=84.95 TRINITY_DN10922_c0_g1_i1:323-1882(+)
MMLFLTSLVVVYASQVSTGLSVVLPEWRPRVREIRGARRSGIALEGEHKSHGEGKQKCPTRLSMKPCACRDKKNGLDIVCEKVTVNQLEAVTNEMKKHNRASKSEFNIAYFKIRDSSIHRLPDYIFMGLNIAHLMIYNSKLSSLMPNSLSSLATSLKHLVLSNNKIQDVPTMAFRQLRELDHINLGQNNISVIKDGAFWGLSKVTRLTLYDNKIHKIHSDAFDGLTKDLLRLSLVRNHLTEIPKEALGPLKNLNQLNLSENKIAKILPKSFQGMDKLDTLAMNHNLLTNIEEGNFEGMPRLTSLALDYNKIEHIHSEAFRGLEGNLQSLSITHNKLDYFPSGSLRPLHQLTTLHLDDNNVTRLQTDAFQGFGEHIKNLWLQNNHIHEIPDESFEDLHSLEWLKLWNNELETLSYGLMEPILDTLKHLDIHSNPLVCNCEMRWYKRWYNDGWQDVDEDHIKDTSCVDPTDGREHKINKIDISHMFCIAPAEVGHLASTAPYMCISSVYLIAFTHLLFRLL